MDLFYYIRMSGRPPTYNDDEHPTAARELAGNGKTLAEMAEVFGIGRSTIGQWVREHPLFAAALTLGRDDATDSVEHALFQRATGYTWKSEKIVIVSGGDGKGSHVERVPITEHVAPDPTAIKYWLGNRRPKDWKDKQSVEHSGEMAMPVLNIIMSPGPSDDEPIAVR